MDSACARTRPRAEAHRAVDPRAAAVVRRPIWAPAKVTRGPSARKTMTAASRRETPGLRVLRTKLLIGQHRITGVRIRTSLRGRQPPDQIPCITTTLLAHFRTLAGVVGMVFAR